MRWFKVLRGFLLDALFPPVCASCKREGDFLCAECLGSLAKRKISPGGRKSMPPEFRYLDGVLYALDFAKNPQIQAAIHQFKYKFTEELAIPFAKLISEKISELGMVRGRPIKLVPVPLHPKRLAERGFNQAEVVARAIQSVSSGSIEVTPLLLRQKETAQQARLDRAGRLKNLEGAFIMNNKFVHNGSACAGPLYFIVDDVCTTGATLDECAKILKLAGIAKVYGLVIARAFRDSHC